MERLEPLLGDLAVVYRTATPVDAPTQAHLQAAAAALAARHDWWAEGVAFQSEPSGHLCGTTRLMLVGYEADSGEPVEVDEDEDAFMAWMDLCVLVDWLAERSGELGLAFEVAFAGEAVGRIESGEEDEPLSAFLCALGEAVGASFDEEDDRRAEAISERHGARLG